MHLLMILAALAVSGILRQSWTHTPGSWELRWQRTLFFFLFPPLLLIMTAIAVLCMGTQGQMVGMDTGSLSYVLALIILTIFSCLCLQLAIQGYQSLQSARNCPLVNVEGERVRLLSTPALFAGQIGFWHPELVVSEGLLQTLSADHVKSVLAHEQGHHHYKDTFWFFWLGWIRSCTAWLPNTEPLWQELLILRELRADSYAASQVDPLLLAESLLLVVSNATAFTDSEICCAALGSSVGDTYNGKLRLEQRIEALLAPPQPISKPQFQLWNSLILAFLPLITIIFHT
ncbi:MULTISPECIES: M56 family metallopeptidase [unclassified Anabaena]|uniref:M56 family metallopeptidase n=1 Tax=unclassified Anabaena TaxID=2619674 RepID=UPI00083701BE|nr:MULTISPECIES: M56 family metallopeptidase [unclassified Anabaena]